MIDFKFGGETYGFLNPFIIAEIGVNHEGSLERAKEMIEQVARGGGHAAKFQTYKADKLATKNDPLTGISRRSQPPASTNSSPAGTTSAQKSTPNWPSTVSAMALFSCRLRSTSKRLTC